MKETEKIIMKTQTKWKYMCCFFFDINWKGDFNTKGQFKIQTVKVNSVFAGRKCNWNWAAESWIYWQCDPGRRQECYHNFIKTGSCFIENELFTLHCERNEYSISSPSSNCLVSSTAQQWYGKFSFTSSLMLIPPLFTVNIPAHIF